MERLHSHRPWEMKACSRIGQVSSTVSRPRLRSFADIFLVRPCLPSTTLAVDEEGWQYGDNHFEKMGPKGGLGKYTRRRAWVRRAGLVERCERVSGPEGEKVSLGSSTSGSGLGTGGVGVGLGRGRERSESGGRSKERERGREKPAGENEKDKESLRRRKSVSAAGLGKKKEGSGL